jgi:uncharacterized protein (TIGR02448 family)
MRCVNLFVITLICVATNPAFAVDWKDVLSSGATTASTYVTFKDKKIIVPARDDASSFIASDGQIRGPYLEAALHQLRADNPQLQASDMALAQAILDAELH